MSKSRKLKKPRTWVQKTILIVIIGAIIAVLIALLCSFLFSPERTVHDKIEEITRSYYEDFIYKTTAEMSKDDAATALSSYSQYGLSTVTIRQILLHDKKKYAGETLLIEKYCDTDRTTVKYYPTEPYGKADYRADINYSCNF